MTGYYLYGLLRPTPSPTASKSPATTESPAMPAESQLVEGLAGGKVQLLQPAGCRIVALGEAVHIDSWSAQLQQAQDENNLHWLASRALQHQQVIDRWLAQGVYPLRFATLVPDEAGLSQLLQRYQDHVLQELTRLQGYWEWTLRVWLSEAQVQQRSLADNPALQQQAHALQQASSGRAYLQQRKLEQDLRQQSQHSLRRLRTSLADTLPPHCHAWQLRERLPEVEKGYRAVLEAVVLLSKQQEQQLRSHLARLEPALHSQLSGPFAPYNFFSAPDNAAASSAASAD